MKTKRFVLGLLSSLFFTIGMVRAAERFDPMLDPALIARTAALNPAPACLVDTIVGCEIEVR